MINSVTIQGRLTKDATRRQLGEHGSVTNFSIANNQYAGTDRNGDPIYDTTYVNCSIFNFSEKMMKYLTTGRMVIVRGRLDVNNKEDRTYVNVVGNSINNDLDIIFTPNDSDEDRKGNRNYR